MPRSKLNESVIVDYTVKTHETDSGAYYAPYIPLQTGVVKRWERIGIDMPTEKVVYNIKSIDVSAWVEEQPIHMWKYYDAPIIESTPIRMMTGNNYMFTDEMESWFLLRWS